MRAVHTPGPWVAVKSEAHAGNPNSVRVDIHALGAAYSPAHVASDIMPEDARLIAAAPEMLAALEACIPWLGKAIFHDLASLPVEVPREDLSKVLSMAGAAIAAARGEVAP